MEEKTRYLEEKLNAFPRLRLSIVPTPCHKLEFLSKTYGVEVY